MGYTPLDDGLPTSTVSICGGPIVLALWSVFMAWKDQDGLVKLTPRAVEALWSKSLMPLPLEVIQQAWDYLASPDPQSANPACAGRRIVPTDDGRWRVVSHDKYRDRHSGAVLRSQAAERQQRRRDRLKQAKAGGSDGAAGTEPEPVVGQLPANGPAAQPAAALSLPQIQRAMRPNTSGSLRPEPGPAGDPEQGQAVGGSESVLVSGRDAHQQRIRVTREATGESVPLEESFKPTVQYPTEADRRAANAEAGELCVWLEARCGRSSGEAFRAAADYPNAPSFKARADTCTAPRLEQTLLTLREWKRRCELNVCGIEASWALKPRPGEAAPRTSALDDAAERIQRRLEEQHAGRGAGTGADRAVDAGRAALPGGDAEVR